MSDWNVTVFHSEAEFDEWRASDIQKRKLIKALARRGEFPEWRKVYDAISTVYEEIYKERGASKTGGCAAIALSMLSAANFPQHIMYGNVPDIWNEGDNE